MILFVCSRELAGSMKKKHLIIPDVIFDKNVLIILIIRLLSKYRKLESKRRPSEVPTLAPFPETRSEGLRIKWMKFMTVHCSKENNANNMIAACNVIKTNLRVNLNLIIPT